MHCTCAPENNRKQQKTIIARVLCTAHVLGQIGKFAECAGDLSYIQIACMAVFVSLNNGSICFLLLFHENLVAGMVAEIYSVQQ